MKGLARYRLLTATLVVLLAGLSVLAAGCPRRAPEEDRGAEVAAGGIMIRGSIADAQTMNPIYVADTASGDITHHLFQNSLMAWNREVELVPNAAESFPEVSADELIYTFRLRPGQTWHDGQPFTSHDVVFTYESFMNPFYTGPRRADMAMFLGYKAYVGELAAAKRAIDAYRGARRRWAAANRPAGAEEQARMASFFARLARSSSKQQEDSRARDAPTRTDPGERDLAASSIVASWVLSPNSARNTMRKVDQTTPGIIGLPTAPGAFHPDGDVTGKLGPAPP